MMIDYKQSLIELICKQAEKKIAKGKDYDYSSGDTYLLVRYFEDTGNIQIDMRIGYDWNTEIKTNISGLKDFLERYL